MPTSARNACTSASDVPSGARGVFVDVPGAGCSLDGIWYETPTPARGGVVLAHGNTMNLAVGAPRFLPPALVPLGFDCLAYNRRSHDILSTRDSRVPVGGAFQTAAADAEDTAAAAAFMAARAHPAPILIGHSNGGMLTAAFASGRGDLSAVVLLSAHRGGRDILAVSCAAGHLAGPDLDRVTAEARRLVAAGRGDELMLLSGWWYVTSAGSFVDRLENTPDLLESAAGITCPVLFVVGDQEPPDIYPAHDFAAAAAGPCDVVIVDDCDHFYRGREDTVAGIVAEWLDTVIPSNSQAKGDS
ncbi:MAG: alpha/beta fold hydrolase [Nitriliruptorales bacterium]|nr:alpha/beta fold hydrolase [Nitriliruptorales bacterium]